MKIAVSGKGGVGKTTISANLARLLHQAGKEVFAVDADADSSLGLALGLSEEELRLVKPIIEMQDEIKALAGDGAMYTLNPSVKDVAAKYSIDAGGIKFLRMGGIKQGGSACYCKENTFLRAIVMSLILDSNEYIIMDMGAGIEHLTRGTSRGVDMIIIVVEPGRASMETGRTVEQLARELGIENIKYIANKVRSDQDASFIRGYIDQDKLLGIIHYDDEISERGMGLKSYTDAVENDELQEVLEQILL